MTDVDDRLDAVDAVHGLATELLNDGFVDYEDEALRAAARDLGVDDVEAAVAAVDERDDLPLSTDLGEARRRGEARLNSILGP